VPTDQHPKPPQRGRDSTGDTHDLQTDDEGKLMTKELTVEGLLYSIDEKLERLLALLEGKL
jgi:hypothetical protein